jgi:serine/threonine-protein kinase HipA
MLVGNMDGHAKNLSLLTSGKRTRLAPFYDLVCTTVYPNLSQKLAFRIGGENRPRWLMLRHWDRFAEDIAAKPRFVRKTMADMIQRVELALPNTVARLQSAVSKSDELLMIEKIHERVRTFVVRMKTKLKDSGWSDITDETLWQVAASLIWLLFAGT